MNEYTIPITYKICKNIRLNNRFLLRSFARLAAIPFVLLRAEKYQCLKDVFEQQKSLNREWSDLNWWDFFAAYNIYGVYPDEFCCFRFDLMNDRGRREYITEVNRQAVYRRCNDPKQRLMFDDKFETYVRFADYFRREAIKVTAETEDDLIASFAQQHGEFIIKPIAAGLGFGIERIRLEDYDTLNNLIAYVRSCGECILEEIVRQSACMSKLHPASVNTVRIRAFKTKSGTLLNGVFLRMGRGGSVVDNAGQGGVFAPIDPETGIISGKGQDKAGQLYMNHPDTGVMLPGFQLPDWQDALSMVRELMEKTDRIRYVGWDLAHTDDGWVVIEGNQDGQFAACQIMEHKGSAREIEAIIQNM